VGDVTGMRQLHNEELYNVYSSQNTIRMIKSRSMIWMGHVVSMGETEVHTKLQPQKLKGRDPVGNLGADRKIILK
jgi:hypothetical protein